MSTDVIQKTNRLIEETSTIVDFVRTADIDRVRRDTEMDWDRNVIVRCDSALIGVLTALRFVEVTDSGEFTVDAKGRAFLGKILLALESQLRPQLVIRDRYILDRQLASGKNSLAYKAEDTLLGRPVVLKFFRPGRGEGVIKNIAKIGPVQGSPVLVHPIDVFDHQIKDGHGRSVVIHVLVFPFVDGMTFREYIVTERNSSPVVIQAFIEQISFALLALQRAGLSHGDMHPNNVMVTTEPSGKVAFRLIDVSYGADEPSEFEAPHNDLDGFKFILRLALEDVQSHLSRISLKRHLGGRIFTLVEYILSSDVTEFEAIWRELETGSRYAAFRAAKDAFLRERFSRPRDFGILRYEEFSDPNVAIKLFCPYPELFERLCAFGSAALFGHRGTGKSTYMAAMTFFPQANGPLVDVRRSLGILFSCRQGEFRKFSERHLAFTSDTPLQIKDILIAKIIRKTLSALAAGVEHKRFSQPSSVRPMADVILSRVQHTPSMMIAHQLAEVESLKATMLQAEIRLIDRLFAGERIQPQSRLLDEHALAQFFEAVRACFSELNQTRFAILFDDAGTPNVPVVVQSLICDLMASTNSIFCVKLSAEKKTFEFLTTDQKPIERVHDVRVYTISDYFSMGGGFSSERRNVEEYFRELVSMRLRACGFESTDIRDYLGIEVMKPEELIARLVRANQGRPVYAGWQVVWQIADRTMRHMLEMISAILDESKTTPTSPRQVISAHMQSRQILRFSRDKLKGLMFLPGTIVLGEEEKALGKLLFEFASSFGKVAGYYLRSSVLRAPGERPSHQRFDERLAIELDNTLALSVDAQRVLDQLIRFAVLDDEKMATSLDDGTRKPIYTFNCVYCPALRISFRRDAHWRLSSRRFEQFLLDPAHFVRTDERLVRVLESDSGQEA